MLEDYYAKPSTVDRVRASSDLGMVMTANFIVNMGWNRNVPLFPDNVVKPFYGSGLAVPIPVADD